MNTATLFSGHYIDRCGELRQDQPALTTLRNGDTARFIPIWRQRCAARDGQPVMFDGAELGEELSGAEGLIFLGQRDATPLFTLELDPAHEPQARMNVEFLHLRELANTLSPEELGLLAYANAMLIWQRRHAFCGLCGAPNQSRDGGFVLACSAPGSDHKVFPRLDPAIIVLVHRHDRCLLGRQAAWPDERFSTIAGFVEPGESLEDAVRREVREESDIRVGECRYFASQPWPFPSSLMIGFHAHATSDTIVLNDSELAEARWVTRDDIVQRRVILPPRMSIAYQLIESWFDADHSATLQSLNLPAPPLTPRR